jgi:DNA-directed RNA polymerase specialized sigma24 family protein
MMQRIVNNARLGQRDDSLTSAVTKRLQEAAENEGESLNPRDVVDRVQDLASECPAKVPEQQKRHALAYIQSLHEPQRTMYFKHQAGVNHKDIARSMGLGAKPVLKSLARIYRDLRFILLPTD